MLIEDLARLTTLLQIKDAIQRSSQVVFADGVIALDNDKVEANGALDSGRRAASDHIDTELSKLTQSVIDQLKSL